MERLTTTGWGACSVAPCYRGPDCSRWPEPGSHVCGPHLGMPGVPPMASRRREITVAARRPTPWALTCLIGQLSSVGSDRAGSL